MVIETADPVRVPFRDAGTGSGTLEVRRQASKARCQTHGR